MVDAAVGGDDGVRHPLPGSARAARLRRHRRQDRRVFRLRPRAGAAGRRDDDLGQPGHLRISGRAIPGTAYVAAGCGRARDGALDLRRDARRLHGPAQRHVDECARPLSGQGPHQRRPGRHRPHQRNLGRVFVALRPPPVPVRRLLDRRRLLRAGRRALPHLRRDAGPGAERLLRARAGPSRRGALDRRGDGGNRKGAQARRRYAGISIAVTRMQIYVVGGAVRDALLGRTFKDHDYVVVGATPEDMLAQGFRPVGKDFPVFLHPQTQEEYALARTERKTAPGYKGFVFHTSPDVTLEDDLVRRDLTINAIARADDGTLTDPYGGRRYLEQRIFRHVSEAFVEDPVRILRVARFAARFSDFRVAPETNALMRQMVERGEVDALVPERVWQELSRGLMEDKPSRMLEVLRDCGALARILPELDVLWGVPQQEKWHPEIDTGIHMLQVMPVSISGCHFS